MIRFLVLLVLSSSVLSDSSPARAGQRPPRPEVRFDSYVLSMSHENEFCENKPDKKECRNGGGSFGMALHGLWPNRDNDPQHKYQYCGDVSRNELGKNWCAPKYDVRRQMQDRTFAALEAVMPGTQSCLYNHEWYSHGTCSGLSVEEYYDASQELAARFIALPRFRALLDSMGGKHVGRQDILNALAADLGDAALGSILLNCRRRGGEVAFMELHISLDLKAFRQFPAPESFRPGTGVAEERSICPESGILITAPHR